MPGPGSLQYVVKGFQHMVLIYEAVFKGSARDGIKARGEDHTHMFEGGVGGTVSPRLLHVLLPVKLRLFFHVICIWMQTHTKKITRQSSADQKSQLAFEAKHAFHSWDCIRVAIK